MFYRRYRNPAMFREMQRLQREMGRLFSAVEGRGQGPTSYPAINIWAGEDSAVMVAELPGVQPDDMDVRVVGDTLTLSGSRAAPEIGEGASYHRRERSFGRFSRTLQLPFKVEAGRVDAEFQKGILKIHLPRAESDKPRKISVKSSS